MRALQPSSPSSCSAPPVAGQEPAAVDTPAAEPIVAADERRIDRSGVFVGATVGSAAGLLIGASGGDSFGGDDSGISSVVLGAVLFDGAAVLLGYTFGQGAVATLVTTIIEPLSLAPVRAGCHLSPERWTATSCY